MEDQICIVKEDLIGAQIRYGKVRPIGCEGDEMGVGGALPPLVYASATVGHGFSGYFDNASRGVIDCPDRFVFHRQVAGNLTLGGANGGGGQKLTVCGDITKCKTAFLRALKGSPQKNVKTIFRKGHIHRAIHRGKAQLLRHFSLFDPIAVNAALLFAGGNEKLKGRGQSFIPPSI